MAVTNVLLLRVSFPDSLCSKLSSSLHFESWSRLSICKCNRSAGCQVATRKQLRKEPEGQSSRAASLGLCLEGSTSSCKGAEELFIKQGSRRGVCWIHVAKDGLHCHP